MAQPDFDSTHLKKYYEKIVAVEEEGRLYLAVDEFLCCTPFKWRIRKIPHPAGSGYVNNPPTTPSPSDSGHCPETSFAELDGEVRRIGLTGRKSMMDIPRVISHAGWNNELSDGLNNEYYWIRGEAWSDILEEDEYNKKNYLDCVFAPDYDPGCFPENIIESSGGVTKSCIRISPSTIMINESIVPNPNATYRFTVQASGNGGSIGSMVNSECSGLSNLQCISTKTKTKTYTVTRNDEECCVINGIENNDEVINCVVLCGTGTPPSGQMLYTTWTDKLRLEVLVEDPDREKNTTAGANARSIWVPVEDIGLNGPTGPNAPGNGAAEWTVTYTTSCWSGVLGTGPTALACTSGQDIPVNQRILCDADVSNIPYLNDPPCLKIDK